MRKLIVLLICLALDACAPYQPKLTTKPKDMTKYEADKNICIKNGRDRKNNAALLDADSFKTPREMADECMALKGYDVVKVENCC